MGLKDTVDEMLSGEDSFERDFRDAETRIHDAVRVLLEKESKKLARKYKDYTDAELYNKLRKSLG